MAAPVHLTGGTPPKPNNIRKSNRNSKPYHGKPAMVGTTPTYRPTRGKSAATRATSVQAVMRPDMAAPDGLDTSTKWMMQHGLQLKRQQMVAAGQIVSKSAPKQVSSRRGSDSTPKGVRVKATYQKRVYAKRRPGNVIPS